MPKTLLIIECDPSHHNWYDEFDGAEIGGVPLIVEQAEYPEITLNTYENGKCIVTLRRSNRPIKRDQRTIQPDFLFVRSVSHGITGQDSRNLLFGFMTANLPSVNTLDAEYHFLERPIVHGALREIEKRLGHDNFPLIPQIYYPSHTSMVISPAEKCVGKIGHAHAGYGKMLIKDSEQWGDFRSIVAIQPEYCTAENFIDWDVDIRLQKIGNEFRAFTRQSPNWKGNVGNASVITDAEMTPEWQSYIDEASQIFGGLDLCALDLVRDKVDGTEYILELNPGAFGTVNRYADVDRSIMRDLVLRRMMETFETDSIPRMPSGADGGGAEAERRHMMDLYAQARLDAERERRRADTAEAALAEATVAAADTDGDAQMRLMVFGGVVAALLSVIVYLLMRG